MAEIPAGWISKDEAIEFTGLGKRTFERTVSKRGIEHGEVSVEGRRPIITYKRADIDDMKRNTVVVRPEVVQVERSREVVAVPAEVQQMLPELASVIASALTALPLTNKLTLTLSEAVAYSGLPKADVVAAIKAGDLPTVRVRPYRLRRSDVDAFVAGMTVARTR